MLTVCIKVFLDIILLYVLTIGLYAVAEIIYVNLIAAKFPIDSVEYRSLLCNKFYWGWGSIPILNIIAFPCFLIMRIFTVVSYSSSCTYDCSFRRLTNGYRNMLENMIIKRTERRNTNGKERRNDSHEKTR